MSEVKYWSDFYEENNSSIPSAPSTFAVFILEWLSQMKHNIVEKQLVDLGCGNARDTKYFASTGMRVIGVDQAHTTIDNNNASKGDQELYIATDFSHIDDERCVNSDFLYSRFSIHSICKNDASGLFQWVISKGLKSGGLFFIEARSIKDPLFHLGTPDPDGDPDASISGHYRRFIRLPELITELQSIGFMILFSLESNDLSICGNDNPFLVRVICQKP